MVLSSEDLQRCSESWDRTPCLVEHAPLLTEQDAYVAALRIAEVVRATEQINFELFVDDELVYEPRYHEFLPRSDDAGWQRYLARARSLAVSGALRMHYLAVQGFAGWAFWDRLVGLLRPLYDRVGEPSAAEVFIASGQDHPLRPRTRRESVRQPQLYPVVPDAGYLIAPIGAPIRVRLGETRIDCEPGRLLYLPAPRRGEAFLDAPSAALIVGLKAGTIEQRADRLVLDLAFGHDYSRPTTLAHERQRSFDTATDLPPALRDVAREVREYSRSREFHELLTVAWLRMQTSFGFPITPPPERERALELHDVVRDVHIRWTAIGGRVVAAANGHAVTLPDAASVRALLGQLVSGEAATIEDLAERNASERDDEPGPEQLFDVLQALFNIHGFAV